MPQETRVTSMSNPNDSHRGIRILVAELIHMIVGRHQAKALIVGSLVWSELKNVYIDRKPIESLRLKTALSDSQITEEESENKGWWGAEIRQCAAVDSNQGCQPGERGSSHSVAPESCTVVGCVPSHSEGSDWNGFREEVSSSCLFILWQLINILFPTSIIRQCHHQS